MNNKHQILSQIKSGIRRLACCLALVLPMAMYNCSYQETLTNSSGDLIFDTIPGESLSKRGRYFIIYPNDTVLLAGMRKCSTALNGQLVSATADSVYSQTITGEQERLSISGKTYTVHPQIQRQGQNLQQLPTLNIRYFELTENDILLRAYSNANRFFPVIDTLVMPHALTTNQTWTLPLLVNLPQKYFQSGISTHGTALVAEFDPEVKLDSADFRDGLLIKLFYELSGSLVEGDSIKRVIGSVFVKRYYIKDRGLAEEEIKSQIQSVTEDGNIEIKKELLVMKRDVAKMQPVPEQLIKTQ